MKKATSIILILIISAVVILSTFCIAFEHGHECAHNHGHEECPICCLVSQCEQTLHQLKTVIVSSISAFMSLLFIIVQIYFFASIVLSNSLVSNKVRLNN